MENHQSVSYYGCNYTTGLIHAEDHELVSIDSSETLYQDDIIKKRKYDEVTDSNINNNNNDLDNDNDVVYAKELTLNLYKYPPEGIQKCINMCKNLFSAFNANDRRTIHDIIFKVFNRNCCFRWKGPNVIATDKIGSNIVHDFYIACIESMPDIIIILKNITGKVNARGYTILSFKFHYFATMSNPKYLSCFTHLNLEDKLTLMNKSKYSDSELSHLKSIESNIKSKGQLIQTFGKTNMKMYLDPKSYEILAYDHTTVVASFAPFKIND